MRALQRQGKRLGGRTAFIGSLVGLQYIIGLLRVVLVALFCCLRKAGKAVIIGKYWCNTGRAEASIQGLDQRSEEHTSELQSHLNLVCRLLLEKKKMCQLLAN